MSIEALRKKSQNLVSDLKEEAAKAEAAKAKKNKEVDPRVWAPTISKTPNEQGIVGSAKIRFLPAHPDEVITYNQWWSYSFKNEATGLYYIEKSLASLKQPGLWDPMAEYNNKLWKTGPAGQEQAKKQKRNLHYVSGIKVISDPANPENNGTVRLFQYGAQIYKKIDVLMFPPEGSDEPSINIFDPWEGLDFNIVIKMQGQYPNYESSFFARTPTRLAKTDEEILAINAQQYPLAEYTDPSKYKTREQLQERINKVFGLTAGGASVGPTEERKQELELETQMSHNDISSSEGGGDEEFDVDKILAGIKS